MTNPILTIPMVQAAQLTLWTLGMSGNIVECEARAHPLGVELRYLLNERLLMSRVFDAWDRLSTQAQTWRQGLEGRGWSERPEEFLARPQAEPPHRDALLRETPALAW
jgi:hypothetical protein